MKLCERGSGRFLPPLSSCVRFVSYSNAVQRYSNVSISQNKALTKMNLMHYLTIWVNFLTGLNRCALKRNIP